MRLLPSPERRVRPTPVPWRWRPLPALLVAGVLAGCGASGEDTAAPTRSAAPTTPSQQRATERPLRYAVLGDSYSNGQSVPPQAAWPEVMARGLTRDGLGVEVVANPSVTGATAAEMLRDGVGPIRAAKPDVITVMLGVNDQVQGRTPQQFEADEDEAVRTAVQITGSPDRVLVVDIPDYSVTPAAAGFGSPARIAEQVDAFNAVVKRVGERRGVRFVSIVDLSRRLGSGGISPDGLHPSQAQLRAWADRIGAVAREAWKGLR